MTEATDTAKAATIKRSSIGLIALLEGIVDQPGSGTLIAFLAVIAGCLASFFTDDIKQTFPFKIPGVSFPFPGQINWIAVLFWIVVLIWFLLFWVQQVVASKTIAFLQSQALEIAQKVVAVSGGVETIGRSTAMISSATEGIRTELNASKRSAEELGKASQEALAKIDSVDQAIKAVHDNASRLQKMVETLPLGPTIGEFGLLMSEAEDLLASQIPRKTTVDLRNMVELTRDLLSIAATFAARYDGRATVRYAANIMTYVAAEETSPYLPAEITDLLRFWPKDEEGLKDLRGVLVLSKDFTSVANAPRNGHPADDEIEPLAFAIPKEPFNKETKKWRVLPGAPRAFVGEGVHGASPRLSTHLVENIGRGDFYDSLDLSPESVKELEIYYGEGGPGKTARSCCTFPLITSDGRVGSVLNIHCDNASWLNGPGERQSNFAMLALPLISEIGTVFELIQEELDRDK